MKVTIDNLDGAGAVDYSSMLFAARPLQIERTLNEPTMCSFTLGSLAGGPRMPVRNGRVMVSCDDGTLLFTGYLASEPTLEYAGMAASGAVYEAAAAAVSDEILLNQQNIPQTSGTYARSAQQILEQFTTRVYPNRFITSDGTATMQIGSFVPEAGESWSENVGRMASMGRAAYRAINGTLSLTPVASTVHVLNESDGSLEVQALKAASVKMLANDVTLCGAPEPAAYATEMFEGDGLTLAFDLTEAPYHPSSAKKTLLEDMFDGPAVNAQLWEANDPDAQMSITAAGLTFRGGTGIDGQTNLSSIDQLELGGTLVVEAGGVQLAGSGDGIVCGLYGGPVSTPNCFAGFHARPAGGTLQVAALVSGVEAGSAFTPVAGHMYTLRARVYCAEMQRIFASYCSIGSNGPESYGGSSVACAAALVLEVQDMTAGISGPVTVLYDGTVALSPAVCIFAPLNSVSLAGSIGSVSVTQMGPVWVTSQTAGGNTVTRRMGTMAEGGDCRFTNGTKLEFYKTSVPQAGEVIRVCYRSRHRSVARLANAASQAQQGNSQIPPTARWIGSVESPAARSSADCENAALAVLDLSCSRLAALAGQYVGQNMQATADVWPGDVLAVTSTTAGVNASLVVRAVKVEIGSEYPELTTYTIQFANDWADDLAIKLTAGVPKDVWLPAQAVTSVSVLECLGGLTVGAVSNNAVPISAGITPPANGGFEVRRRDWAFGPGTDSDLVLRSPAANFSIPRTAAIEQYYIRMYDGASPPNYSRFSAAVLVNVTM